MNLLKDQSFGSMSSCRNTCTLSFEVGSHATTVFQLVCAISTRNMPLKSRSSSRKGGKARATHHASPKHICCVRALTSLMSLISCPALFRIILSPCVRIEPLHESQRNCKRPLDDATWTKSWTRVFLVLGVFVKHDSGPHVSQTSPSLATSERNILPT